ncbi:MAG: M43 family zinc metalloprotease, partial [Bacteroidia bacterium]
MKKLILLTAFSFICYLESASQVCGFDQLLNQALADPDAKTQYDSLSAQLHRQINQNNYQSFTQPNNYIIPVVVHLVGSQVSNAISDLQVASQIDQMNDAFANLLGSTQSVSDDAQIRFCLASQLPTNHPWSSLNTDYPTLNSTSSGITRCITSTATSVSGTHYMDVTGTAGQTALANVVYFNPANYLNIWVVNSISSSSQAQTNDVFGYSPYPLTQGPSQGQYLDGIVVRADCFGNPSLNPIRNRGLVAVHEAGHYLNLFHTYQFGCSLNLACNAPGGGDEVCDTPPVANQNAGCSVVLNSCFETPIDLNDMLENYMDHTTDACRSTYTVGQVDRMHAGIQTFRSNLVSYPNLILTGLAATGCLTGVDPTFASSLPNASTQLCVGSANTIGFNSIPGASSYTWSLPGASPATSSTLANPTGFYYTTPGVYLVTLTVTDANGLPYSSTQQIFVTTCTLSNPSQSDWYFGQSGVIDFSTGVAVAGTQSSMSNDGEGCAGISSSTGNLLFYSNGMSIWDQTHAYLANSSFNQLEGSPNSTAGSAAEGVSIAPDPANANRYYIFTVSDVPMPSSNSYINHGLGYSIADMSSGNGVLTSTVNNHPSANYATTESVISVPACNGTDYWIIVKPTVNAYTGLINVNGNLSNATLSNSILAYRLSASGLSNTPVVSSSGPYTTPIVFVVANQWITSLKVSPNKKYIALSDDDQGKTFIYRFDCETGILNYLTTLTNVEGYSCSFSPNSQLLYAASTSPSNAINQYDLSNLSECNPNPPHNTFTFNTNDPAFTLQNWGNTLQLGPDNKIYISRHGNTVPSGQSKRVAVINFPDVYNTGNNNACGYNFDGVILPNIQYVRGGLPNMNDGTTAAPVQDFTWCISNCGLVHFTPTGCGTNFNWSFGENNYSISGANGTIPSNTNNGTTSGNYEYPAHQYPGPGTYTVSLVINSTTTITHTVIITTPPPPTITGPNPVCVGQSSVSYYGPTGYNCSWTAVNGTPTTGTGQTFNINWNSFPATLTLVITDPATGCTNSSMITVTQTSSAPVANAGSNVTVCQYQSVQLNGSGNGTYQWTPLNSGLSCSTCANPVATPTATTVYTLTVSNGCGASSATVTVTLSPAPPVLASAASRSICLGSGTNITATGASTYTWSPGTGLNTTSGATVFASPPSTITYTVTGTNSLGCSNTATITITVVPLPTITVSPVNPAICVGNNIVLTAGGASTYTWTPSSSLSSSTGTSVTATPTVTTTYTVTGTASTGCVNTTTVTVTVSPGCVAANNYNSPATLSGTFSGTSLAFNADITVSGTLNLVNCNITVLPNKRITVPSGATLTIQGTYIKACNGGPCNSSGMWYGIYVATGGTLNINGYSIIEDAQNAVITDLVTGTITGIPSYSMRDVIFNKNTVAVMISQHPNNLAANAIQNVLFTCRSLASTAATAGNFTAIKSDIVAQTNSQGSFTVTLSGTRSQQGVYMYNVTNGNVGVPTSSVMNYFENMDYGIYIKGSTSTIVNNSFIRLQGQVVAAVPYGVGVYAPPQTLPSINRTITVGTSAPSGGNTFTNVLRGIDIHNHQTSINTANTFSCSSIIVTGNSQQGECAILTSDISSAVNTQYNSVTNFISGIKLLRNSVAGSLNPLFTIDNNTITNNLANVLPQNGIIVGDLVNNTISTVMNNSISYNDIQKCNAVAIKVSNIKNKVTVSLNPNITVNYAATGNQYGVWLETCSLAVVKENPNIRSTYTGTYTSVPNQNIRGIYVYKSTNNLITCNHISQLAIGIDVEGTCTSPTASGPYGIYSNSFDLMQIGLRLMNLGVMGQQGTSGTPRNNTWTATPGAYVFGQTNVNGSNPANSVIYGLSGDLPTFNSGSPAYSSTTLFTTTGTEATCVGSRQAAPIVSTPAVSFNLYPNPNDGNMILDYATGMDAEMIITDGLGKEQCSYHLSKEKSSLSL